MRPPGRVPPTPSLVAPRVLPRTRGAACLLLPGGLLTGPRAHALLRTARQIKNVSPFPEAEVHAGWTARARRWEASRNRPARPPAHAQGARPACPAATSAPRDGRSPGTEAATPRCTRIAGGQQEARGARASGRRACAQQSCAPLRGGNCDPRGSEEARQPGHLTALLIRKGPGGLAGQLEPKHPSGGTRSPAREHGRYHHLADAGERQGRRTVTFSPNLLTHSLRSHALAVRTGVRAGGHGGPVNPPSGVGGQHSL